MLNRIISFLFIMSISRAAFAWNSSVIGQWLPEGESIGKDTKGAVCRLQVYRGTNQDTPPTPGDYEVSVYKGQDIDHELIFNDSITSTLVNSKVKHDTLNLSIKCPWPGPFPYPDVREKIQIKKNGSVREVNIKVYDPSRPPGFAEYTCTIEVTPQ